METCVWSMGLQEEMEQLRSAMITYGVSLGRLDGV